MNLAVVIVAGGKGKRFGSKQPKQFLLLNKKPMFLWSVLAFKKLKQCKQIILVIPENKFKQMQIYKKQYGIDIVCGGKERYDSVRNGLKYIKKNIDIVAVHDGARPLVTNKIIKAVFNSAVKYGAAIAATPAKDSIKFSEKGKKIDKSVNRKNIWQAQTPQIFKTEILKKVYSKKINNVVTDDSQLVEQMGKTVMLVDTGYENFKVTQPIDFKLAEIVLKNRGLDNYRIGS